ncbi:golgin subfamily A member 4-like [Bacillus rossius redtenbacheri]|uniref:golgin subfamily A member 4-like n=1 Tax=Bacillus rossius redtenbacheri TaxID=93214 RepID=UPI002FDCC55D
MNPSDTEQFEDEWSDIQERFKKEGLDFENLRPEERLLHVWRWLVDAESNLQSSRRQLDKLRELRSEEMEEMESYIGHIRSLAEKRADHLESETLALRARLESSQQQAATLATLLEKSGLERVADDSLGEQVAFLIADRAKLMEEIEVIKKLKFSNGVNGLNKESELLSEIIKVSSEKEVLRREVSEMCDRVQLLEKASRQLELDNERLAFKLSEALAELEERESQLKHIANSGDASFSLLWPGFRSGDSPRLTCRRSISLQRGDSPRGSFRQSSLSSAKIGSEVTKVGSVDSGQGQETSTQTDPNDHEKEAEGHKSLSLDQRSHSYGADSTPPSLLLSEFSCGSPKKLASLLDSQIAASRTELVRLEEIKKLQCESEGLKSQLCAVTEKYNGLAMRHIQYKAKRRAQVDELRSRLDAEVGSLQCQVDSLQSQLSVQRKVLMAEESFRERVETDYRQLQEEKRTLMVSVMQLESSLREKERELTVLARKIALLETANSDLLAKVLQLKYAAGGRRSKAAAVPKSNSAEGILTDLGTV